MEKNVAAHTLRIGQVIQCTEAEGPGKRFAIWVQGCAIRCPGCCNPEFLPEAGGTVYTVDELVGWIERAEREDGVEGVTLLGGEPIAQATGLAELCTRVRQAGLGVMMFSGHTLEEIQGMLNPAAQELLWLVDILVDGPYQRDKPETHRRWIGSTNQRIHFLTKRYSSDDVCWREPNTLEIRLNRQELTVNGFPAGHAKQVWRRKPRPIGMMDEG